MKNWGVYCLLMVVGCFGQKESGEGSGENNEIFYIIEDSVIREKDTETEREMREMGLVDIQEVVPAIRVSLVYATSDNFCREDFYTGISGRLLCCRKRLCVLQKPRKNCTLSDRI